MAVATMAAAVTGTAASGTARAFGYGWFLPILPAFYATYWFGGIPYYYANDAYYTWSPDYNGYVQTDPPAGSVADDGSAAPAVTQHRRGVRQRHPPNAAADL
jgi:hypothetical protein